VVLRLNTFTSIKRRRRRRRSVHYIKITQQLSISASVKTAARRRRCGCFVFLLCKTIINYSLVRGQALPCSAIGSRAFRQETTDRNSRLLYFLLLSSLPTSLDRPTQSEKYRVGDGIFWTARDPMSASLVIMKLSFTCYCCRDSTKTILPYRLVFQDQR
jgi:hypothetical protein